MTLEFYKAEEARLLKVLSGIDPSAPDNNYNRVLNNLENLALHVFRTQDVEERLRYAEENDTIDRSDGYFATQSGNVLKLTPAFAEEHPVEQPLPEPEPEPEPEPAVSFDELKSRFVAAARAGVDVGAIIADRGYNKLSDVPKSEYADLLEALPEAT